LAACQKLDIELKSQKIVIQGFGKVGSVIARILDEHGCKIIAVSDRSGGIHNERGLDIIKLLEWKNSGQSFSDLQIKGSKNISLSELFEIKCDVMIPCAIENQITSKNVDKINCKIILEGANGPVTSKADAVLNKKKILVIPDILANGGAVCVSYFEYIQDIRAYFWKLDRVYREMKTILLEAFDKVWELSKEKNISLRNAAYMIAIYRVSRTHELRGLFP